MIPILQKGLAGHEQLELGNRKLMIDQCQARQMPKERRQCLVNAQRLEDLAKCRDPNDPGPVQRRPPTGSASGSG